MDSSEEEIKEATKRIKRNNKYIERHMEKRSDTGKLEESNNGRLYPIYKARDEDRTGNYRGVALLNTGYKILVTILNNRLKR